MKYNLNLLQTFVWKFCFNKSTGKWTSECEFSQISEVFTTDQNPIYISSNVRAWKTGLHNETSLIKKITDTIPKI